MQKRFYPIAAVFILLCAYGTMNMRAYADVVIKGLDDNPDLKDYIETVIEQREDREDFTARLEPSVDKALKAKGYYDAVIDVTKDGDGNSVFDINPGAAYTINRITVENGDSEKLTINKGDILDANAVLDAQRDLYNQIEDNACYYNLDVEHKVVLDTDNHTAEITFTVLGEGEATFGETTFNGATDIERDYLYEFIEYDEGDCWKQAKLEKTKAALYATGLLASATTTLPEILPEGGQVPVTFDLKQRAFRSIKLGAGYNTNDGAGVSAEWEHRNFFGDGERVNIKARLYEIVQTLGATFNKPFFLRDDQTLTLDTSLNRENNDSYKEFSYNFGGAVERQFTDEISVSLGADYELSRIEDEEGGRNYGLFSIPSVFTYDNRDDILDPHEGWRFQYSFTPFFDTLGEADPFMKHRATASTYFDLSDSKYDPVLALRGSIGSIQGADAINIPANKRFYAGGGGSIRGFGYQDVGPRESDGDAAGGLSIIEMTSEMRFKMTEAIGAVAFVDAGQVYEKASPDFGSDLAVGAGVGARYYTSFGPIRFDVATPVTRRDQADGNYQVYLSIGQAF